MAGNSDLQHDQGLRQWRHPLPWPNICPGVGCSSIYLRLPLNGKCSSVCRLTSTNLPAFWCDSSLICLSGTSLSSTEAPVLGASAADELPFWSLIALSENTEKVPQNTTSKS